MSDEFPVSWTEDHRVTRRAFARSLASASACSFGATALLALAARGGAGPRAPEVRVAAVGELPIGGARVFEYVAAGGPCILLRLAADSFVAYAQRCTHLGCPVIYQAARRRLYCPCHEGFFDAGSGEVLAGPPPRRLPRIELERRGLELWAVGVRP